MNEVITQDNTAMQPATPMTLIQMAVSQGSKVSELKELFDLQLRWEQNEAKKAFVTALNAFKQDPPRITRDKTVDFTSTKGRTHYKHASLDSVSDLIGSALSKVGISHRWETEQLEGGMIKVTCILTHALGHSERVTLQAGRDESGNKNNIQAVGSTVSYLQRYTLLTATGMAVHDADDDGRQGAKGMDEKTKDEFIFSIAECATTEAANALWQKIATACTAAGDIPAYDELKAAMSAKVKALKKPQGETI